MSRLRASAGGVFVAVALAAAGLALAWLVSPFPRNYSLLPPLAAVLGTAWLRGLGPGLLAAVVSLLGILLLWIAPRSDAAAMPLSDLFRLGSFALLSIGASLAGRQLRRARRTMREHGETIARQLAELESTYAHAPVGLCVLDDELRWVRVNERLAEMNGLPVSAHLGRRVAELLPDVASQAEPILRRILETGEPLRDVELVAETPAAPGVQRVWREHFLPLRATDGRVVGVSIVAEEITEQRAAERERERLLAELQQRTDELAATTYAIAHDLRSPLRALDGYAYLLGQASTPDEREEYVQRLRATSQRMAEMLDGLLALARVSREPLVPQRVDLGALAREALAERLATAPERQVELRTSGNLAVRGDARLLTVTMQNLIDNAFKFTAPRAHGVIEVGSEPVADEPTAAATAGRRERVYFVRDNGIGLDPAHAGQLFRPFHRLHGADEFAGHGLGLATVARIVARHGGRIWLDGAPDAGATVRFTLPGAPPEPSGAAPPDTATGPLLA